jgi:hypothetical protein
MPLIWLTSKSFYLHTLQVALCLLYKLHCSALEEAFTFASFKHHYWLDRQAGEVIVFADDIARQLIDGDDLSDTPKWRQGDRRCAAVAAGCW